MKIVKTASGNKIKISKNEWESIGKKSGWVKEAGSGPFFAVGRDGHTNLSINLHSYADGTYSTELGINDDAPASYPINEQQATAIEQAIEQAIENWRAAF